jgi:LytS/YehU family sensor histidine kinase
MNNLLLMGSIGAITIVVLLFLLLRQQSMKKRAIERAESIRRMAELELQSLRSQLNPHFMFNSLNSIQELILMEKNEMSHSYLARFSKLLRILLENAEKTFVPLQKELEFLQLYLGLESLRVPDLQYKLKVAPDVNTRSTLIPNMILQPYIENAIWHGLSHKSTDKKLEVRVSMDKGSVKYEIEDNGIGRKKAAQLKSFFRSEHKSVGMELLNKRFKLLNKEYSSDIRVNIADVISEGETAGTLVTIEVPVNISKPIYSDP